MTAQESELRSYHGQPVLKEPTWTWEIPCYLFTGGLAGASAGLACLSELRGNDALARRAWGAALVGVAASPGFLISDLGRPTRFLNMLRVFKVTSPMSVGSWILSGSGTLTAIAAANAWLGLFPRLARTARPGAALLGLPLATYTGALLSNTAIPVWHEARRMLPFVFASGAGMSAGAAAVLVTPVNDAAPARRLALAGAVAEMAAMRLMQQRLGDLAQPYRQGSASRFERAARGCLIAGTGLLAARAGRSRAAAACAAGLLLAGALSARFSVYKAGFGSAADPKYVVGPQRERVERGERPGASRRSAARSR
jgi:formate-dependent nitrite reductase membrane component NrfD